MKQPTGWQNAPPLSPGRCLQAHRAAGTPRGGSPAPYSQEVHWAPSLQEHPRELRHPVDRERLGGALTLAEAGHTFPNRHLCFLHQELLCPEDEHRSPRCVPASCTPSLPWQHMFNIPAGALLKSQASSTDSTWSPGYQNQLCQQL